MNARTAAVLAAKLLVSAGLLALVLAKVDLDAVLLALRKGDPLLVLLWYLFVPLTTLLVAWRWKILAPGLTYRTALKYTWIGVFFGHVLPGSISGDIAKGVSLALKDSNARAGLAASIVAEKVIGLAALLVFFDVACLVVYLLSGEASGQVRYLAVMALALSALATAGGVAVTLAALRGGRLAATWDPGILRRAVEGVGNAARFYANKPTLLWKAVALSVVIHSVNIAAMWLSFLALRVDAGLLFASVVYPIVSVMLMVPISISGIGVRDVTFALLFGLFGLAAASGVALSWLGLLATIPNLAIGGSVQLWEMYRRH